ncbi:G19P1 protein [Uncinocarpus reesii 1704]|uniref:Glucosidase 2 subunit beta n=1 Tax=Uncinocarpus reesii (strain UAMH 1704) TaxID=336963 RepID=C4JJ18_UNCRE|nr:G19P1 protein [Uncinocarpus reesii 1704]EEP76776.1 G19P1 protein [Uncinocarpus reesii 1704]
MTRNHRALLLLSLAALYTGATAAGAAARPRGVGPEFAKFYKDSSTFTCISNPSITIAYSAVNDDYCDCPDGSDEPGTSACSFISNFSPSFISDPGDEKSNRTPALPGFYCKNKGHKPSYVPFQRVNDGVCDYDLCCDGSDEWAHPGGIKCENKCKEIGKEWRKKEESKQKSLNAAMKKRRDLVQAASKLKKETEDRVKDLEVEVKASKIKVRELEKEVEKVFARDRGKIVKGKKQGKVNVLAGLARDRVEELRTSLVDVRFQKEQLETRLTELEGLLSKFKDEYNPNFNDEGVKRAVRSWEDYVAKDHSDMAPPHQDLDELTKPDGPDSGINWEQWENEQDESGMSLIYKVAAYLPPSLVNYMEDKLAEFRSLLISNGILAEPDTDSNETQAVREARDRLSAAESSLSTLESSLAEHKEDLGKDFGKDSVFLALKGSCISKDSGEYNYELCWMDRTTQKSKKGRGDTVMGNFDKVSSVTIDEATASGRIVPKEKVALEYINGQKCWNGPSRSTKIILECGENDEILKVAEDEKCVYSMYVTTPAVCESSNDKKASGGRDEL